MVIALVVSVAACGALVALLTVERMRVVRRRRRCPVVVTLKSGGGFKGVLVDDDSRAVVLRNVESLEDAKLLPVDGEVIVPWSDVKYLQRL